MNVLFFLQLIYIAFFRCSGKKNKLKPIFHFYDKMEKFCASEGFRFLGSIDADNIASLLRCYSWFLIFILCSNEVQNPDVDQRFMFSSNQG